MTRDQVNQAVQIALQALGNKKTNSIRKACKVAGITPTTLYNKTTDEQREAARRGEFKVEVMSEPKKRGRPARNPSLPKTESRTSPQYVAKLERALLKRLLIEEE